MIWGLLGNLAYEHLGDKAVWPLSSLLGAAYVVRGGLQQIGLGSEVETFEAATGIVEAMLHEVIALIMATRGTPMPDPAPTASKQQSSLGKRPPRSVRRLCCRSQASLQGSSHVDGQLQKA